MKVRGRLLATLAVARGRWVPATRMRRTVFADHG